MDRGEVIEREREWDTERMGPRSVRGGAPAAGRAAVTGVAAAVTRRITFLPHLSVGGTTTVIWSVNDTGTMFSAFLERQPGDYVFQFSAKRLVRCARIEPNLNPACSRADNRIDPEGSQPLRCSRGRDFGHTTHPHWNTTSGKVAEGPRRTTIVPGQMVSRRQCDEDGLIDRPTAYHAAEAETSCRMAD
ncbi:hypothetical protein EVAR_59355_1 [Eumeta japonica]|uniref:Uncharacterized protein n=1 Tax=Eumeta variegata TaxID=151549 RepID=A0A4C2A256_EUMVA|nr:hypothetical protein EVAR_59355_1 [Eumeta japonica]